MLHFIHLQPLFITTLHTPRTIQQHVKKLKQANYDYQKLNQPKLTSYTINFVHQPCPPNLIIATFLSLNHGLNLLHQSCLSSMTRTNSIVFKATQFFNLISPDKKFTIFNIILYKTKFRISMGLIKPFLRHTRMVKQTFGRG